MRLSIDLTHRIRAEQVMKFKAALLHHRVLLWNFIKLKHARVTSALTSVKVVILSHLTLGCMLCWQHIADPRKWVQLILALGQLL